MDTNWNFIKLWKTTHKNHLRHFWAIFNSWSS